MNRPRRELTSRRCLAEPWSTNLVRWLNVDRKPGFSKSVSLSRQRILDLVETFRRTLTIVDSAPRDADLINFPPRKLSRLLNQLDERLARYSTSPTAYIELDGNLVVEDALAGRGFAGESLAAHAIIEFVKRRLLNRVRRCICGKHFYANFLHQRFCSANCRHKSYEQTAGFKKRRREYMRNYYRLKRSGKVK